MVYVTSNRATNVKHRNSQNHYRISSHLVHVHDFRFHGWYNKIQDSQFSEQLSMDDNNRDSNVRDALATSLNWLQRCNHSITDLLLSLAVKNECTEPSTSSGDRANRTLSWALAACWKIRARQQKGGSIITCKQSLESQQVFHGRVRYCPTVVSGTAA